MFKQYSRGHIEWVGRAKRHSVFKYTSGGNSSLAEFLKDEKVVFTHARIRPDLNAGFKSFFHYDRPDIHPHSGPWDDAWLWLEMHFQPYLRGSITLSEQEAIAEIDHTTSPGYPWSLKYVDKTSFFASHCASVVSEFWDVIAMDWDESPFQSCVPYPIWTCAQKRELRSVEKVALQDHRTFTAAPVEHTVALARLCHDMNQRMYDSVHEHSSFLGGTKYLGGWERMYKRLRKHTKFFHMDGVKFDRSLARKFLERIAIFRWRMLSKESQTPENFRRLMRLYDHIINSVVILENGELVQKFGGNPSGSGNTSSDNTDCLYVCFAYAWLVLCHETGQYHMATYEKFRENVELALNGDDNLFSVSDAVSSWYNATSISGIWLRDLGIATKGASPPMTWDQTVFLSMTPVVVRGYILPSPNYGRVLSSVMYGSAVDDDRVHFLRTCALRLDSWPNEALRTILDRYLEWLCRMRKSRLVGSVVLGKQAVTMESIFSLWKPDHYCFALYTGLESARLTGTDYKIVSEQQQRTQPFASMGKKKGKKNAKAKAKKQPAKQRAKNPGAFNTVGRTVGGLFGPMGERIGGAAGSLLGSVFGSGAYKIRGNSLAMGQGPPVFARDGSLVLSHREFVTTVSGATSFTYQVAQSINPSNPVLFPWLAQIASHFQRFEMLGLLFEYKATSAVAVNSTNTALGTVIMATNYDPDITDGSGGTYGDLVSLKPFASKQAMEVYQGAVSTAPALSVIHAVECAPATNPLKSYYVALSGDPRFNSLGTFTLATDGQQAVAEIGELWVTYHVRLSEPYIDTLGRFTPMTYLVATSTAQATGPFLGATTAQYNGCRAYLPTGATNYVVVPEPGNYMMVVKWIGSGASITAPAALAFGANITELGMQFSRVGSPDTEAIVTDNFKVNVGGVGSNNRIIFAGLTGMVTATVECYIIAIPSLTVAPTGTGGNVTLDRRVKALLRSLASSANPAGAAHAFLHESTATTSAAALDRSVAARGESKEYDLL